MKEKELIKYLLKASEIYYSLSMYELNILSYSEKIWHELSCGMKHSLKKRYVTGTTDLSIAIRIYPSEL